MKKRILFAGCVMVGLLAGPVTHAADHTDGTSSALDVPDASSDINDVFAWMGAGGASVNLAMTVFPGATTGSKFSDAVKYVFHVNRKSSLVDPQPKAAQVICTFNAAQTISCWVIDASSGTPTVIDYVTGDPSNPAGLTSASGKVKVFAGLRDDPFFFNLAGFKVATAAVAQAAAGYAGGSRTTIVSFNSAGCPTLAPGVANTLLTALSKDCSGSGAPQDFFAKPGANATGTGGCVNQGTSGNVLAIVLQIDKSLLTTSTAGILGVWGSTNK